MTPGEPAPARLLVTGHYAGAVSRAAAAALDIAIVIVSFTAGLAGLQLLARSLLGITFEPARTGLVGVVALIVWAFVYVYVCLVIAGRTVGKGIVGLRVVKATGATLTPRKAFIRTLVFPLSLVAAGIGLLLIIVQREHRALHDLIAGTAVVYDWGGRAAELPGPLSDFLARQAGTEYSAAPATPATDVGGGRRTP